MTAMIGSRKGAKIAGIDKSFLCDLGGLQTQKQLGSEV